MRCRRHGYCALLLLLSLYAGALMLLVALPAIENSSNNAAGSRGSSSSGGSISVGIGGGVGAAGGGLRTAPEHSPVGSSKYSMLRRPRLSWCRKLTYLHPPRPPVALVSFPGSGNTWVRYLLQQATGLLTGSVYHDHGLRKNGFPAEGVVNGSVAVVKTHEWGEHARRPFARAVLLVRAPAAAILAEFNRQSGGHVGHAAPDRYRRNGGKYWQQFVREFLVRWRASNLDWALNFKGPCLLLPYEALVRDPGPPLRRALRFLGLADRVPESSFQCALERREGIFRRRRRHSPFDPFTDAMKAAIAKEEDKVMARLRKALPSADDPEEGVEALHLPPPVSLSQRGALRYTRQDEHAHTPASK